MNQRQSLTQQIAHQIRSEIANGQLPHGSKMPSLRNFSQHRNVAKNTVVTAYEELVADGFIEPRKGSGFFVRGLRRPPVSAESWAPALDHALAGVGIDRSALHESGKAISVGEGLPPSEWLANCRLDRYMQKIARSGLGTVFRYGDPFGYLPLRQSIARKLQAYGINTFPNQIILTQGAYQAVDIVVRHLVKPGDNVLVDMPGFYPTSYTKWARSFLPAQSNGDREA
jgi:DNA-binding transcriptional MocR family regulator